MYFFSATESNFVSVERIKEYLYNKTELIEERPSE